MKSLIYWGGLLLGVLCLFTGPRLIAPMAYAEEQAPILDSWSPTQIDSKSFGGATIVITGQLWPNKQYGLSAFLFDRQTLTRIPLTTFSYTPLDNRMVVEVPSYIVAPATGRMYDIGLTTINGTQTITENAILVEVLPEPVVSTPPSGGNDQPEVTPPLITPIPTPDIVRDTTNAPSVSGYSPDHIGLSASSASIVITGDNWPMASYGLSAYLVDSTTGQHINLETISYVPDGGRLVVQTPAYTVGSPASLYDLVIITINGERTTIHNAIAYSAV